MSLIILSTGRRRVTYQDFSAWLATQTGAVQNFPSSVGPGATSGATGFYVLNNLAAGGQMFGSSWGAYARAQSTPNLWSYTRLPQR